MKWGRPVRSCDCSSRSPRWPRPGVSASPRTPHTFRSTCPPATSSAPTPSRQDSGYFANFDPHAVRLEVTPLEASGPTKSQFLIVAAVTDENGQPRRSRRVEWMVQGVGNIVEVDESGYFAGRGYKVDNQYAVCVHGLQGTRAQGRRRPRSLYPTRTNVVRAHVRRRGRYARHRVRAGDRERERHKVFVTRHWCDAEWRFPPAAACPAGGQPVLSTQVMRLSDRQPLTNYKVRYRVLDGPPAQLLPSRGAEAEVVSDDAGQAKVTLAELTARPGSTRVAIEVVRPEIGGPGVVVGRGETTLEWQAPQLALAVTAPPTGVVGQDMPMTITVSNPGQARLSRSWSACRSRRVRSTLPANRRRNLMGITWSGNSPHCRATAAFHYRRCSARWAPAS